MNTLELFNAVKSKTGGDYVVLAQYGVIIEPSASWAQKEIVKFLHDRKINGQELNATFHKSWKVIENTSRGELLLHQLLHYMTTYGTGHTSSFVYTPDETLEVPQRLKFTVIRGLSEKELTQRAIDLLSSGVALKAETISAVIEILDAYNYKFTGEESIKNKEALMILCDRFGVAPKDPVEQVRLIVYKATGKTLLIKNKNAYKEIAAVSDRIKTLNALLSCNAESLATVFNRFKPILLQLKKTLNNPQADAFINRISKLSKTLHKPMSRNVLNDIGHCSMEELNEQRDNLLNANFFQLARALQYLRSASASTDKIYQVRNGKCFVKAGAKLNSITASAKVAFLLDIFKEKYSFTDENIYIPAGVFYALPTSEKLFVGNVPFGSKFVSKNIALGVFWREEGGASDIDLSATSVSGKVGWNRSYNDGEIMYSGDMTSAYPCATEYLYAKDKLESDQLIMCNIYRGNATGSEFNIIVGEGDNINRDYMMSPDKVLLTAKTASIKKEGLIGLVTKDGKENAAIVFNLGFSRNAVSCSGEKANILRNALAQRWKNCFYINDPLEYCGAKLVDSADEATIDLSPQKLARDTIVSLFAAK